MRNGSKKKTINGKSANIVVGPCKQASPPGKLFARLAQLISREVGRAWVFILAVGTVAAWAASGPYFDYSDTWQLVINTGTTIVTFLMVFLIQNTQNRDAKAMHLKLDELIRAVASARNRLVHLEDLSDADLAKLEEEFKKLHDKVEQKFEEHKREE